MSNSEILLDDFFRDKNLNEFKFVEIESQNKCLKLKEKLEKKSSIIKWKVIYKEILDQSSAILNIKLHDVLVAAWQKYDKVTEFLNEENYNINETFLIPLIEHTVVTEHSPKIEVLIDNVKVEEIQFQIYLELLLKGIILRIKQGKIEGATAGSCIGSGYFNCENIRLFECSSAEFSF